MAAITDDEGPSLHSIQSAIKNLEKVLGEGQNGMKEEISKISSAMENFHKRQTATEKEVEIIGKRQTRSEKKKEKLEDASLKLGSDSRSFNALFCGIPEETGEHSTTKVAPEGSHSTTTENPGG